MIQHYQRLSLPEYLMLFVVLQQFLFGDGFDGVEPAPLLLFGEENAPIGSLPDQPNEFEVFQRDLRFQTRLPHFLLLQLRGSPALVVGAIHHFLGLAECRLSVRLLVGCLFVVETCVVVHIVSVCQFLLLIH